MYKKFEFNQTKIYGDCQLRRKLATHDSMIDLPLYIFFLHRLYRNTRELLYFDWVACYMEAREDQVIYNNTISLGGCVNCNFELPLLHRNNNNYNVGGVRQGRLMKGSMFLCTRPSSRFAPLPTFL